MENDFRQRSVVFIDFETATHIAVCVIKYLLTVILKEPVEREFRTAKRRLADKWMEGMNEED